MKILLIPFVALVLMAPKNRVDKQSVTVTSGKLIIRTESCGGNSDNKDHNTQVYTQVFGNYGYVIAFKNYTDDREFPDNGSSNEIPLNIGDPNSNITITQDMIQSVQKIQITINPNGHDTWTFDKITAVFSLSDGNTRNFDLNACVLVNQDRKTATIISNPPNDWVQY